MRRSGFTLLEVTLVLAIILIAGALSLPSITAMMEQGRVWAARDMVRGQWADVRGRAMNEGIPYSFSIQENTGKFKVAPWVGCPS